MSLETQHTIITQILGLIKQNSHVVRPELNLSFAVRLLSCHQAPETEEALNAIFKQTRSPIVRRDVILAMAKWGAAYWLSNLKADFRILTPSERRAFIVASYRMFDEGKHWRKHIQGEFSPFERITKEWASERVQSSTWSIPI